MLATARFAQRQTTRSSPPPDLAPPCGALRVIVIQVSRFVAWFRGLSGPARSAIYMLSSAAMFAAMSVMIRIGAAELHAFEIVFFRSLFGLVVMLPWLVGHAGDAFRRGRRGTYLIRSLFSLSAMLCSFYATAHMAIADAIALSFAAPLFATAGAALFLGEIVRLRRWSATLLGFAGVMIILRPGIEAMQPAAIVAVVGAAFIAGAILTVKSLSRTEPTERIVANMAIYLVPLTLIPALFVWTWPSLEIWIWMAVMGAFGTVGQILMTRGFAVAEASLAITFDYARLPFAALIAFIWFGEIPTLWTFIGTGVIAAATLYIARREAQLARQGKA